MSTTPHLRLVDVNTGEVSDCSGCRELTDVVAGLERDIRGWSARYAELKRDRKQEARDHPLWPVGKRLFSLWKEVCKHPNSAWTPDRFWEVEPHLSDGKFGEAMCERAIHGAAYDPYITKRKNGSTKRHDDWDLIFRNRGKAEEFACRAPRGSS